MLRIIAISLMLLLTVGVMLPFANEAHGVRQSSQAGMRRHHRYHSRACGDAIVRDCARSALRQH